MINKQVKTGDYQIDEITYSKRGMEVSENAYICIQAEREGEVAKFIYLFIYLFICLFIYLFTYILFNVDKL